MLGAQTGTVPGVQEGEQDAEGGLGVQRPRPQTLPCSMRPSKGGSVMLSTVTVSVWTSTTTSRSDRPLKSPYTFGRPGSTSSSTTSRAPAASHRAASRAAIAPSPTGPYSSARGPAWSGLTLGILTSPATSSASVRAPTYMT